MANKIVICSKDLDSKGGVANFYREINEVWDFSNCELIFFVIGSHSSKYSRREKRYIGYLIDSIKQYYNFYKLLKNEKPNKVVVNPSLIPVAVIRDGIYILISHWLKIKTITFIRGWREGFFGNNWISFFFETVYKKTSAFIVLSEKFKRELGSHFLKHNISVVYTAYDDLQLEERVTKSSDEIIKMIYISRISKLKGFFELLMAVKLLNKEGYDSFSLNVYGHFSNSKIETEIKKFLDNNREICSKIHFLGYADKKVKYEALSQSHLFLLPSYMEGCPNSVIEATASGCFVIATDVGAIPEIVEDNHNGILVEPKNELQLKDALIKFFENKQAFMTNCLDNKIRSKSLFDIQVVKQQLYTVFMS